MHCDHAFYAGATPQNIGALAELEKLPGVCGIKAFLGSSTGTLLLEQGRGHSRRAESGQAPRRGPFRRRRPHDRPQASGRARQAGNPSGLARCGIRAHVHRTRAAAGARRRAAACMCCMSPPATRFPLLAAAKDFSTAETTPQHLTLSAPECYERLGTYAQMNPPIRDESHRQALWAGGARRRDRRDRLRSCAAHARGKRQDLSRHAFGHARACRPWRPSFWIMSTRAT